MVNRAVKACLAVAGALSFIKLLHSSPLDLHESFGIDTRTYSIGRDSPKANDIPLNYSKVATIFESRPLQELNLCLLNFLTVLPPDWPVVAWLSEANYDMVLQSRVLQPFITSERLNLTILERGDMNSTDRFSDVLMNPWIWQQFVPEAEHMLMFQTDSVLCANSLDTIDNWIGYDWVGHPVPWGEGRGGNGGLSIRKISSSRFVTENVAEYSGPHYEDMFFVDVLTDLQLPVGKRRFNISGSPPSPVVFPIDRNVYPGMFALDLYNQERLETQNELSRPLGIHTGHTEGPGLFFTRYDPAEPWSRWKADFTTYW